jgi:hypothetical protein
VAAHMPVAWACCLTCLLVYQAHMGTEAVAVSFCLCGEQLHLHAICRSVDIGESECCTCCVQYLVLDYAEWGAAFHASMCCSLPVCAYVWLRTWAAGRC